jgi:hypothetical protein
MVLVGPSGTKLIRLDGSGGFKIEPVAVTGATAIHRSTPAWTTARRSGRSWRGAGRGVRPLTAASSTSCGARPRVDRHRRQGSLPLGRFITGTPAFVGVPKEDRHALREANEARWRLLSKWWRRHFAEEIREESLLDVMLSGVWTFAGWPPDMIGAPDDVS